MRLLIFTAVVYVALRMLRGRNWTRVTLAISLGVIGTLSIVIGPVSWLTAGHNVGEFLAGADLMLLLFASSRVVHLIAVFAALVLMFRPPTTILGPRDPRGCGRERDPRGWTHQRYRVPLRRHRASIDRTLGYDPGNLTPEYPGFTGSR